MRRLRADGVPTRRGVMAVHKEAAYAGAVSELPYTERASERSLMLPLFAGLSDRQQDYIMGCLTTHVTALAA